jgi:hypothetical protein
MTEDSVTAKARFVELAKKLGAGPESASPHRKGFGTGSLFVGKKMFGLLDGGSLVLKLSPQRVQELIAAGVGAPWHPGKGAPLKEYVAISVNRNAMWLRLAKESRTYMTGRG